MTRQLGLGLLLVALLFGIKSSELMMGTMQDPGPGWFPFWLSMCMLALALCLILMPPITDAHSWPWMNLAKATAAVLAMSTADVLGLWLCSFICMMIMRGSLSLSVAAATAVYTTLICVLLTAGISLPLSLWPL